GLLLGPSGLGRFTAAAPSLGFLSTSSREAIASLAEFGIILLLFSIGLELSFRRLCMLRRLVFLIGSAEIAISGAVIGFILFEFTSMSLVVAMTLGIALALWSTALVLPMTGTQSAVGKPAFSMLLFEDLAIVPIIFVLGVI